MALSIPLVASRSLGEALPVSALAAANLLSAWDRRLATLHAVTSSE
jgi:hypothetical protein